MRPAPDGYEEKFQEFIALCNNPPGGAKVIIVAFPEVLGDTYEEIVESLGRVADAGLQIGIAGRS